METHEADESIRIIFDTAPIACCIFDNGFNIFDCNQETLRMFCLPDKQVYFERFFELSPERQPCGRKSRDLAFENNNKAFLEGHNRFEWMHQTFTGELLPCEIILLRVKYKEEYAVAGYIRDLREQKALLEKIHNENERYKTMAHWYEELLDAIPFLISAQDNQGNWTFINKAFEDFFGRKRDEVIGLPCNNWGLSICDTDKCAMACARRGVYQTNFTEKESSYLVDTKLLKDLEGKTTGYIELIQDITKIERMAKQKAEAEAASSAKSSFLATMSHEIKIPVNAILGMAAIGKKAAEMERKNFALNKIEDASRHFLGVINDVLDMSRIEAKKLELSKIPFDLNHSLNKAVSLVQFMMDEKHIHFSMKIGKNMPSVFIGDDHRLTQVITNLLSNAVKFTPEEGRVDLGVSLIGEEEGICTLRFDVSDSGIGMSLEQQKKIFDVYEQADKSTTRRFSGAGLGLPISKRIVELMNGRIWVESRLGKGAKFCFTIKLLREINNSLMPSGQDGKYDDFQGKKILIVDDLDINREALVSLLDGTGLIIDAAKNGKEAIDMVLFAPNKYDMVFMDIQMPEMDGIEASRQIRALPLVRNRKLPIIAMTASVLQEDIENGYSAGIDDYIGKPVDIVRMLEKLYEYLP